MPRVLMVSSLWPPVVIGGAEIYASQLAERLEVRGSEVHVVTAGVPGDRVVGEVRAFPYRLEQFATQSAHRRALFHVADLYRPATKHTLAEAIAKVRPDVVHTHSVQGLSSTALSAPSHLGVAHVHTIHDYWLRCQRTSMVTRDGHGCDRQCRPCAAVSWLRNTVVARHPPHVALAVSAAVAREHEPIDWLRGRIRVVYNPVESADRVRPPRTGPVTFGYLGQLSAVKGVGTLLDAFTRAELPEGSRLLVAGEGAMRAAWEGRTGPAVEFVGWLDEAGKERFFADVDALIVPSEWKDPAPLVLNEAVGHGVPVIGARIGGIPELIPPSCSDLMFTAGRPEELVERLRLFAAEPGRWPVALPPGALDWNGHVDAVLEAYADARAASGAE